jgi:hypothetical protein
MTRRRIAAEGENKGVRSQIEDNPGRTRRFSGRTGQHAPSWGNVIRTRFAAELCRSPAGDRLMNAMLNLTKDELLVLFEWAHRFSAAGVAS